jgi:hypothetical protein
MGMVEAWYNESLSLPQTATPQFRHNNPRSSVFETGPCRVILDAMDRPSPFPQALMQNAVQRLVSSVKRRRRRLAERQIRLRREYPLQESIPIP